VAGLLVEAGGGTAMVEEATGGGAAVVDAGGGEVPEPLPAGQTAGPGTV